MSISRRLSDQISQKRADGEKLRQRISARCRSISKSHSRDIIEPVGMVGNAA